MSEACTLCTRKGHRKEPAHPTGRQITGDNEFTIVAGRNHEGWAHAKGPGIIVASLSSSSSSWSSSLSSSSSSSSSSCHHLHDLHQYLQAGPTRSILTTLVSMCFADISTKLSANWTSRLKFNLHRHYAYAMLSYVKLGPAIPMQFLRDAFLREARACLKYLQLNHRTQVACWLPDH